MNLPDGFRAEDTYDGYLLVNDGPHDAAAGRFPHSDAPALWSRQVLTDGRLRAVTVVPPVEGTGSDQFQSVHATAEQTADLLGIGAVEVAVCWAELDSRELTQDDTRWSVTALGRSPLVLLLTDAVVEPAVLHDALSEVWHDTGTVLAMASGASGDTPAPSRFTDALSQLHKDAR